MISPSKLPTCELRCTHQQHLCLRKLKIDTDTAKTKSYVRFLGRHSDRWWQGVIFNRWQFAWKEMAIVTPPKTTLSEENPGKELFFFFPLCRGNQTRYVERNVNVTKQEKKVQIVKGTWRLKQITSVSPAKGPTQQKYSWLKMNGASFP